MNQTYGNIAQVDTAYVKDNQTLALSVHHQDVERCQQVIREYGVLTPPVVGSFSNGTHVILSGECEFLALRELGIRNVEVVAVPIDEDEAPKLSLLISSLKKSPNAISEGIMAAELMKSGKYTQFQLAKMLGKSKSWVNKRIGLVTRLNSSVREMVTQKLLCPHSAQEIARLPQELQHEFSTRIVQGGLPKSAVETLVSTYNAPESPTGLKVLILEQPHFAIEKITKTKTVKKIRSKNQSIPAASAQLLQNSMVLLLRCIKDGEQQLPMLNADGLTGMKPLLMNCRIGMQRYGNLIEVIFKNVSLGKLESEEQKNVD
jgi:ParB family chromosome partitioning protein